MRFTLLLWHPSVGNAGEREDVVDAHDEVGNQDRAHGLAEGSRVAAAVLDAPVAVVGDELDGDEDEGGTADGDLRCGPQRREQPCRKERADDAHEDGADATDDDGLAAHLMRQVLAGQSDEDGVVAGEQQVERKMPESAGRRYLGENISAKEIIFQSIHSPKINPYASELLPRWQGLFLIEFYSVYEKPCPMRRRKWR